MKNELCEDCVAQLLDYFGGEIPKDFPVCIHCHHDDPAPEKMGDREERGELERVDGYVYKGPHGLWLLDTEEVEEYVATLKKATLIVWKEKE